MPPTPSISVVKEYCNDIPRDPCHWAQVLFYDPIGLKLWVNPDRENADQRAIVNAPFKHQKTAIGTGHGISKTESTSVIIPLWAFSHVPSYVIVTSASWVNVQNRIFPALLRNIQKLDPDNKFWPRPLLTKWTIGSEWGAIGISPEKVEVAQGWHSRSGTLVIIDEGSHLTEQMLTAFLSLIKSPRDSIVIMGNPIRADGPFAQILRGDKGYDDWHRINISSEESPNYKATKAAIEKGEMSDEEARGIGQFKGHKPSEVVVIPGLQTYSYCRSIEEKHGRQSPIFCGRVAGVPPDQSEDTLIPVSALLASCAREGAEEDIPTRICVDVAWSEVGDDTVIGVTNERRLFHKENHKGWKANRTQGRILNLLREFPSISEIRIDRIGVGVGVYGNLLDEQDEGNELLEDVDIYGVQAHLPASDQIMYKNVRAESWGLMGEAMKEFFIIPYDYLHDFMEVTAMTYFESLKGQRQLTDKRKFRETHNYSPDNGDMLSLNFAKVEGERAWTMLSDVHQMGLEPTIYRSQEESSSSSSMHIHLKDLPLQWDRGGELARIIYYSHRMKSGCIWVHMDHGGCWTVYRCKQWPSQPLSIIVKDIADISRNEHYVQDLISAPEETNRYGDFNLIDAAESEFNSLESLDTPIWIPESSIRGMTGLDSIYKLLLGTLARFPDHPAWDNIPEHPDAYQTSEMLVVWPKEMVKKLRHAKFRTPKGMQIYDETEKRKEDLVGGGDVLVKCLRLLAVKVFYTESLTEVGA